jgi:hypothetical protein
MFTDYMARARELPVTREPGCTCGKKTGDWDEDCPLHPMDDSDEWYEASLMLVARDHSDYCQRQAAAFADRQHGGFGAPQAARIGLVLLADGDAPCTCRSER